MFLIESLKSAHLFCGILLILKRYVNKMTQLKMIREISIIQCFQFYDEGYRCKNQGLSLQSLQSGERIRVIPRNRGK